jgi:alkylhydroperoxidase family enzyme
VGSEHGVSDEQLMSVANATAGAFDPGGTRGGTRGGRHGVDLFSERTLAALSYADAMTMSDVDEACFARVAEQFDDDELVELTAKIAWENSSARFNRALRVESQRLWQGPVER